MLTLLPMVFTAYGYLLILNDLHGQQEHKASLTQLLNRRKAMRTAVQTGTSMGILVADIDHFKKVNDVHGNLPGDAVIQRVAEVLRNQMRKQYLRHVLVERGLWCYGPMCLLKWCCLPRGALPTLRVQGHRLSWL